MSRQKAPKLLAVLRSEEARGFLAETCAAMNGAGVDVVMGGIGKVDAQLINSRQPDVLLLDLDLSTSEDTDILEGILRSNVPRGAVVATSHNATLEGVRRLMRLDVADFLPQPFAHADLMAAIEHAVRKSGLNEPQRAAGGKVWSFIRPVGGVGSTMLAVQAACELADRNKEGRGVCLLDLDIQFGSAGTYLDVTSTFSVIDLLHGQETLDGTFLRGLMAHHKSGVDVLVAPSAMVAVDALTPELIGELLSYARAEYGHVVVDLPVAWTDWTQAVLAHSDAVLLVTELSVAAIAQTRRLADYWVNAGLGSVPLSIVANRFEKHWGDGPSAKEAEKALGRKVDYFVPNDPKTVTTALNEGVRLSEVSRRSKATRAIEDLVSALQDAGNASPDEHHSAVAQA
ncbi:MAG: AAA family ATPase [Alphaproteobacteria bacterium]